MKEETKSKKGKRGLNWDNKTKRFGSKEFTKEEYEAIVSLHKAGFPQGAISKLFRVDEDTLRKHVPEVRRTSKISVERLIENQNNLWATAKSGNVACMIYWDKSRGMVKEKHEDAVTLEEASDREIKVSFVGLEED